MPSPEMEINPFCALPLANCRSPKDVPVTKLASALGRLALCHPQMAIVCRIATSNVWKKVATRSSIPETDRYTRVAKSAGPLSCKGLIVEIEDPKKKPETQLAVTVQEVSINGIPVVYTRVHEYVDAVYKGVVCNQKGPGQIAQPPSYLLQLECSPEHVTFNGPALERSALVRMPHGVQQLLASVLLQAWGKIMTAAMVGKVQAAMQEPVLKATEQHKTAMHSPHAEHVKTQGEALSTIKSYVIDAAFRESIHEFVVQRKDRRTQCQSWTTSKAGPMDTLSLHLWDTRTAVGLCLL